MAANTNNNRPFDTQLEKTARIAKLTEQLQQAASRKQNAETKVSVVQHQLSTLSMADPNIQKRKRNQFLNQLFAHQTALQTATREHHMIEVQLKNARTTRVKVSMGPRVYNRNLDTRNRDRLIREAIGTTNLSNKNSSQEKAAIVFMLAEGNPPEGSNYTSGDMSRMVRTLISTRTVASEIISALSKGPASRTRRARQLVETIRSNLPGVQDFLHAVGKDAESKSNRQRLYIAYHSRALALSLTGKEANASILLTGIAQLAGDYLDLVKSRPKDAPDLSDWLDAQYRKYLSTERSKPAKMGEAGLLSEAVQAAQKLLAST